MKKKTKTRKILTLVLAAMAGVLLAAVLLQISFLTKEVELTVQSTEAAKTPGETVTVAVMLDGNPGFTDYEFWVDYDRTRLELLRIHDTYTDENGVKREYFPEAQTEVTLKEEEGEYYGYMRFSLKEQIKEEGIPLCSITFRILDEAPVGVADVWIFDDCFIQKKKDGQVREIDSFVTEGGILVGEPQCNHVDDAKDTVCDLCGKKIADIEVFDVSGANMSIGDGLELNYIVRRNIIDKIPRDLTAHVIHHTDKTMYTYEVSANTWKIYGNYYIIPIAVSADQMPDHMDVEFRDSRGYTYNRAYSISVRGYAEDLLKMTNEQVIRTLLVDMLNYGASAQIQSGYKTENLANDGLTQEQQGMAGATVICSDSRSAGDYYVGSSLSLKEGITLNLIFDGIPEETMDTMYAQISYTNAFGEPKTVTLSKTPVFDDYGEYGYGIAVDQIMFVDVSQIITVTIRNADGTVFATASDSVESYISRRSDSDPAMKELYSNIMKFSASVYNYIGGI